jgi:hypothetical protein
MEFSADGLQAFSGPSVNWEIKDVNLMHNIHTIDSSLANSYAKHPYLRHLGYLRAILGHLGPAQGHLGTILVPS